MIASESWLFQLRAVARPLFTREIRWRTVTLAAGIIALLCALNALNIANSYIGRNFMTALAQRDVAAFYTYAIYYAVIFAASALVAIFYQFFQDRLALFWRQTLTRHFLREYLTDQAYYRLKSQTEIDNPDQRITEDVRNFCGTFLSFFLVVLNSTITIIAFAGILWSISPRLFAAAVAYAAAGSLITGLLGYRLVNLNFLNLSREADLRYSLVRIREYAEPIALLHGEPEEEEHVRVGLERLVEIVKRVIAVNRNMGFFTSFFNYLIPILPVVLVAPLYLRGEIEFGQVTQSAMAFAQFLGGLAVFIAQFQNISSFAAVVRRLGSLEATIGATHKQVEGPIHIVLDETRVAYEKLTLKTPTNDRVLIRELNLEIPPGRRLLVSGVDGAGKSALFRATAGFWNSGEGAIRCPDRCNMMFLPHKPYTIPGTLRDQILYGTHGCGVAAGEERIREVLHAVKFDLVVRRVGGLDAARDWMATLSAGEQQLLAFVRLLLAAPHFAFLDRAISSLGPQCGRELYQLLSRSSITYLSVGDHMQIREFHDWELELSDDGSWKAGLVSKGEASLNSLSPASGERAGVRG